MLSPSEWIEENRPSGDPDYRRVTKAVQLIERQIDAYGSNAVLDRIFSYDTALNYACRRVQAAEGNVLLEAPTWQKISPRLTAAWPEGFIFGVMVYKDQRRGRQANPLLDRIALVDINHALAHMSPDEIRNTFDTRISGKVLAFVSVLRSMQVQQEINMISHQLVQAALSAHWLDGFLLGLYFEFLGGHREAT